MKEKKLTARAVEHAAPGMHGDGNGGVLSAQATVILGTPATV